MKRSIDGYLRSLNTELQRFELGKAGGGGGLVRCGCNGFVMMCGFDFALMRRVLAFFFFFLVLFACFFF